MIFYSEVFYNKLLHFKITFYKGGEGRGRGQGR
jgi:hypothetical protein